MIARPEEMEAPMTINVMPSSHTESKGRARF